jgi:glucose-1-phosphate cytidylyltransferase
MKVVLFCGGMGMRLREYSEAIPKPMVNIGYRPILWNVMRYYAHYGHKEFILCLGYKGDVIKNYFINYNEAISNDFILTGGNGNLKLLNSDIHDWKIAFADTGQDANVGQRLKAVEKYIGDDEYFLANYSDGLTDLPLSQVIDQALSRNKIASFVSVKPSQTFHVVKIANGEVVKDRQHVASSGILINGGYFTFKRKIFDYIRDGEELVCEPFRRLIQMNELVTYVHHGFFVSIEIGCGGTMLKLLQDYPNTAVSWIVFASEGERAVEAQRSALAFLKAVEKRKIAIKDFRDGFFPYQGEPIKEYFEQLKQELSPNLIFTHYRHDLHQDHRLICELTWNTFRDHFILEYEIPKYAGDLGAPNVFVQLDEKICEKKIALILRHFQTQRDKRWFTDDAFRALMRLRGLESQAPEKYAEGFYGRKIILQETHHLNRAVSADPVIGAAQSIC